MNIENLKKLSAHLRSIPPKAFEIQAWANWHNPETGEAMLGASPAQVKTILTNKFDCGTVACIAGHAVMLASLKAPRKYNPSLNSGINDMATLWLDLDDGLSYELFCHPAGIVPDLTPSDAAIVIDNLIKTGEVDWDLVRDNYPEND